VLKVVLNLFKSGVSAVITGLTPDLPAFNLSYIPKDTRTRPASDYQ